MVSDPLEVDPRPNLLGTAIATVSAAAGAVILAPFSPLAAGFAGLGVVGLAAGGLLGGGLATSVGTAALLAAVVLAGIGGVSIGVVVAASLLAVLAWDSASNARSIGIQVGRGATAARAVLAHAAGTLLGGSVTAAIVLGVYHLTPGRWPLLALALVLLGAGLLVFWLDRYETPIEERWARLRRRERG